MQMILITSVTESSSIGAQYVAQQKGINWMKKSQNMPVWLRKLVLAKAFCYRMLRLVKGTADPNSSC
jgi:hypothetical protein